MEKISEVHEELTVDVCSGERPMRLTLCVGDLKSKPEQPSLVQSVFLKYMREEPPSPLEVLYSSQVSQAYLD